MNLHNYRDDFDKLRAELIKAICDNIKQDESFICRVPHLYIKEWLDDLEGHFTYVWRPVTPIEIFSTGKCCGPDNEPYGLCEFTTDSLLRIYESIGQIQ